MKKTLLILFIVMIIPFFAFSTTLSSKDRAKIARLSEEAKGKTDTEALLLYSANQMYESTVPYLINSTFGFGIGSFVQGDTVGGILGLGGDVAGSALIVSGFVRQVKSLEAFYEEVSEAAYSELENGNVPSFDNWEIDSSGALMIVGGAVVLGVSRLIQASRPFRYAQEYNKQLGRSLTASLVPTFGSNGQIGATLSARVSF